ncbi:16S rRNA (guanine(966)-N(2))-methyltransferase RsmD [Gordonia shandongensis]|uniref:16S rRNA (guanine(966)-N(2))-methyltransferase RsmD n=1 Tax=Gordonia shandongensis TaxID=376351 RepID=UPI000416AEED|nr:16S rRNA (guanine(966)-N(2))-methyltransferase RsmD [Gordonia shandongensis]
MTRIISGDFRGRRLAVPADTTRPTSDRVREAVFSMLGSRFDVAGMRVLDLYAGTGALGLEAVSRGGASAVLVEADRRAAAVVRDNIAVCRATARARVVQRSAEAFLAAPAGVFDLVFLDPPYEVPTGDVDGVLAALVGAVADGGWVVLERGRRDGDVRWPEGFDEVVRKQYGDSVVLVATRVVRDDAVSGGSVAGDRPSEPIA